MKEKKKDRGERERKGHRTRERESVDVIYSANEFYQIWVMNRLSCLI